MMTHLTAFLFALIAWSTPFVAGQTIVARNVLREASPSRATILFGGDLMFDRSVRTVANEKGDDFLFSCIDTTLQGADLVVANLEGPITTHASKSVNSKPGGEGNYTFTFPTSTAPLLKRHNISLVNLGNNHMLNFSREGLVQTKEWLDQAGVSYFGDPDSLESDKVARLTFKSIHFSFVNWSDWTSDNTDQTITQVRREAQSGRIVVVYTHWGEEYLPATEKEKRLAHDFIDAGASIVIGSHPHIVQEHEIYKGKNIYYSLGNFIFDQYWNEQVRTGLLLKINFGKTGVLSLTEIPIRLESDRRTCLKE